MHDVKIYTSSWCRFCKDTKEFLSNNNVQFKEINVENDENAAMHMVSRTGQASLPVIEIDGKMIVGFNKNSIISALNLKEI